MMAGEPPVRRISRRPLFTAAGQYQQAPAPLGGGLVKATWFKHYREDELPVRFDRIVQSWDAANKTTKLSDFSFCTTWGVRTRLLAEGEAIIQSGSGAHSQLYFYRDAMEASLAASDWAEALRVGGPKHLLVMGIPE